jgi:hypothetical protein
LTAGGDGQADSKMTLAGAGFTNQQDWFGAVQPSLITASAAANLSSHV